MNKILIIEDDAEIGNMTADFLRQNGYEVVVVNNGIDGVKAVSGEQPDVILLDLMLPYKSGDQVLSEIRAFSRTPVIIISAKTLTGVKIEHLRLGADDYVTKPFDLEELLARIEVQLRKSANQAETMKEVITYGEITMNQAEHIVTVATNPIELTALEYRILLMLLEKPERVFTKQFLYENIWNETYAYDDNTINTHISNIRKKIKRYSDMDYIETVWGIGYKMMKL